TAAGPARSAPGPARRPRTRATTARPATTPGSSPSSPTRPATSCRRTTPSTSRLSSLETVADPFSSRALLEAGGERYEIFRLDALQESYDVARLPYTLRIL